MIERCRDRQRKFDGLEKYPFHLFVESLPIMLQIALLLLSCGLCRYMASISASTTYILITLTTLGILFYILIVIAGASSYECPFQTPVSITLRGLWEKVRPHATLLVRPIAIAGGYVYWALRLNILHPLWNFTRPIALAIHHFEQAAIRVALNFHQWVRVTLRPRPRVHQSPAISLEEIQEDSRAPPEPDSSPHTNPLEPWLEREDLGTIRKTNTKDVRCVSWILRNITDPEALDAAIRFAGTTPWFEDGVDVELPYNIIVSTFHTCWDSTGTVYPGLSDRAYHSARAILWIHINAMCKTEEYARNFPLPQSRNKTSHNLDLNSLLEMYNIVQAPRPSAYASVFTEYNTPKHMQWASHALLYFCWTKQEDQDTFSVIPFHKIPDVPWNTVPLDATLNLFLVWSIFLGCPIQEEALKIQDKTCVISRFPLHIIHMVVC